MEEHAQSLQKETDAQLGVAEEDTQPLQQLVFPQQVWAHEEPKVLNPKQVNSSPPDFPSNITLLRFRLFCLKPLD